MFQNWLRYMPFCFVVWLARRNCSVMRICDQNWHHVWDDVLVLSDEDVRARLRRQRARAILNRTAILRAELERLERQNGKKTSGERADE